MIMAKKRRLLWQLYPSYLLVTIICLVAVSWYATTSFRNFYLDQSSKELEARARLVQAQFLERLEPLDENGIQRLSEKIGRSATTRVTVILPSGRVVGDTDEDPITMDNHANRPEIKVALSGQVGTSTRYSRTVGKKMKYLAIPIIKENRNLAVIRVSIPVIGVDEAIRNIQIKIAVAGLVIAVLAALLSLIVSRRISQPIERIKRWSASVSQGVFDVKPPKVNTEEIAALSDAMNRMTVQLVDRIKTVSRQRNELEAVLSSMVEGVIAVDNEERVIRMNQAAERMLRCHQPEAQGRTIQEVVRNVDLQNFVKNALGGQALVEKDIVLHSEGERILNGHGTILGDDDGNRIGALLVLDDVTHLRKLENIRRDFVSNVSHEIKTPITAIKGFSETLRAGSVKNPEEIARFLGIIDKHVDRLAAIVEDLLSLSRIEREEERKEIILKEGSIKRVLQSTINVYEAKAREKQINIHLKCEEDVRAPINTPLLELAVGNILDNAIKYSEPGKTIRLEATEKDGKVAIKIQDQGIGIAKEHIPRVFERFYRVDKARSRRLGGTGLGLALVKHIIQSHGGHVSAESQPGKGSLFTIQLPGV